MKYALCTLVLLTLILQPVHAQWWNQKEIEGNGRISTQTRHVSDYDKVAVQGNIDVRLMKGKEGKIQVEAEENLMEYITIEILSDKLSIETREGYQISPSGSYKIVVDVPYEDLSAVRLTGSGNIRSEDLIYSDNFEAQVTGSGTIDLPLQAKNARAGVTGSGDIVFTGEAKDFHCNVTGSGDISAFEFKCERVEASVTGSGDIEVFASEEIRASTPGSGDITYKGNPAKETTSTIGKGNIRKH